MNYGEYSHFPATCVLVLTQIGAQYGIFSFNCAPLQRVKMVFYDMTLCLGFGTNWRLNTLFLRGALKQRTPAGPS
jgi:hypothetical protein